MANTAQFKAAQNLLNARKPNSENRIPSCPSLSRTGGGIFEIERNLAQRLSELPQTALEGFRPFGRIY